MLEDVWTLFVQNEDYCKIIKIKDGFADAYMQFESADNGYKSLSVEGNLDQICLHLGELTDNLKDSSNM